MIARTPARGAGPAAVAPPSVPPLTVPPLTVPPSAVPPSVPPVSFERPAPRPTGPPSYPPRRELRDTGALPTRTSTTTGRRIGSLTWPLLALGILVLALLGAALADSLWGSDPGAAAPATHATSPHAQAGEPGPAPIGGMISQRAPAALTAGALSTTAKDA
ncbi:hypothetical protein [Pengzhenrongella phosphoraccumulans]|uniref:hypothetical protein n=1 Tax=Pengzhenrongella phosphoraccumulans TaxID=3114394 RepID=UPI0038911882